MTPAQLDELEVKAKAAFRGPWTHETWEVDCHDARREINFEHEGDEECGYSHDVETIQSPDEYPDGQVVAQIDGGADGIIRTPGLEQFAKANGAFIAAANPQTVLTLIEEIRRLQESTRAGCPSCVLPRYLADGGDVDPQ